MLLVVSVAMSQAQTSTRTAPKRETTQKVVKKKVTKKKVAHKDPKKPVRLHDAATGNVLTIPYFQKTKRLAGDMLKFYGSSDNGKHTLEIYSRREETHFSHDLAMFFIKSRNFGKLYRTVDVKHPNQTGQFRYYRHKMTGNGKGKGKGKRAKAQYEVVCVTMLPGFKSMTYLIEAAPSEKQLVSPQIVAKSSFKHVIFKNHYSSKAITVWLWISLAVVLILAMIYGEVKLPKLDNTRRNRILAWCLSAVSTMVIFALAWYNTANILICLAFSLPIGIAMFALLYPKLNIRTKIFSFFHMILENL